MTNEQIMIPFFKKLYNKLLNNEFVIDKSGVKTVELICPQMELDPTQDVLNFGSKKTNELYLQKEYNWYMSKDLSIVGNVDDVKIWNQVSDINNEINSNYGYLVYGRGNFNQFDNVLKKLIENKDSRQAVIYYGRPSIHYEANSFGCGDFICTFYQQFLIRNNELMCITSMRSNDAIFGCFNDIPWFHSVIRDMYKNLLLEYSDLKIGKHIFTPNSFHVYERHFDMLKNIVDNSNNLMYNKETL
jgi:thymidylate synthase